MESKNSLSKSNKADEPWYILYIIIHIYPKSERSQYQKLVVFLQIYLARGVIMKLCYPL
jgi:hypothetical protein